MPSQLAERVPQCPADPRPRRDLRPVVDLARGRATCPNLLFDTAWWIAADLAALFSLVPPGQILFASDAPYGNTSSPPRSSSGGDFSSGSRATRSARSRRGSRSGSPPASRSSRPAPRSASATGPPTSCSTAWRVLPAVRRARHDARQRRRPRCSRSRGSPATFRTRSTTRRCSRRSAGCRRLRGVRGRVPRRAPADHVPDPRCDGRQDAGRADPGAGPHWRFRSQINRSPVSVSRSSTSSIVSRMNGTSSPARPPVAIANVVATKLAAQPPDDPLDLTREPVHDPAADRVDGRLARSACAASRARP